MSLELRIAQVPQPLLEFGGAGSFSDPKYGLREAGPFDLRFGAAHNQQVKIGLIGSKEAIRNAQRWFQRCSQRIPSPKLFSTQYPEYPGFENVFHASLALDTRWTVDLDAARYGLQDAVAIEDSHARFSAVLDVYTAGIKELTNSEASRPDVVVCCLSPEIIVRCWSIRNSLTKQERIAIARLRRRRTAGVEQLGLFDSETEEIEEDLVNRDFRRALKARAMRFRMPVQLGTNDLFLDTEKGQDSASRAWNSTVALYYKAGGIPWRLKLEGPTTCFVGITFHHLRTRRSDLVFSGIAQAFSTDGEGFALRGVTLPWDKKQGKQVHLTSLQSETLGSAILKEYQERTGTLPLRIVLHKSSAFDEAELEGFENSFRDVPVIEAIALVPTDFRLVRFGSYPPKRGTLCVVNDDARFLFTTGFMPEWETYPGPHVPTPIEIQSPREIDIDKTAFEIMALSRINWNTASISGGQPVTLSFSRRVGGIMAEVGEGPLLSSFRYYM